MAMFTLIEINGDHLTDIESHEFGFVLAAVVRNPSNAKRLFGDDYNHAVRVLKQSGEPYSEYPMYQCPRCTSINLEVDIRTTAKLSQQDGNLETSEIIGDHEWDDNSTMFCKACGHTDRSEKFATVTQQRSAASEAHRIADKG
jgi:hypothetical protein